MGVNTRGVDESKLGRFVPINALSPEHRRQLARFSDIVEIEAGTSLSASYDGLDYTYYLLQGSLGLYVDDTLVETIEAGTPDARFALHRLRSTRLRGQALSPVQLLRVEVSLVSTLLIWMQSSTSEFFKPDESWVPRVFGSELFARIPPANLQHIFDHLETVSVRAGDVIVREGEPGDYYYIIREGRCAVTRARDTAGDSIELAQLEAGDSFGEEALLAGATRNATVHMLTDGQLMRLTKEDFHARISEPVTDYIDLLRARSLAKNNAVWLDVRVAEEFAKDGLRGSENIPLAELRSRISELDPGRPYIICSNSGRRATAAAFLLTENGLEAHVLKDGLIAARESPQTAPAIRENDSSTELRKWGEALETVSEEVETALQEKLEATSARRLLEETTEGRSNAHLEAKRKRLELASATATAALSQAQRRKLEVEAKLRSSEANAARRRAHAEVECENLRIRAQHRLRDEEKHLREQYALAASKLDELKRTREETEARLRQERERLEREFEAEQRVLQLETDKITENLERIQRESDVKAKQIRSEEATEEKRVRHETEHVLREERQKLEAAFARSVAELDQAQGKLRQAEAEKTAADAEAKRVVAAMRTAEEMRRAQAEVKRREERTRLEAEAERARTSLALAQEVKTDAEQRRRVTMQKLARIRTASGEGDEDQAIRERDLRTEIERMDASVSEATGKLDAAQRARDDAEAVRLAAEEKTAKQRATEEELRLKLHDEAEDWLHKERRRSQAELDRVKQTLALKWKEKEEADKQRREVSAEQAASLFADVSSQLTQSDESLRRAIGEKAYAEETDLLARNAQEALLKEKERAQSELAKARERLTRLKQQGLID